MNAPDPALRRLLPSMGQDLSLLTGLLEQAVLHSTQAVVATDAQRRVAWVNPAFERLTGYSLAEARGRSPREFLHCDRTDPATVLQLRQALNAGQPARATLINRHRSGRLYWVDLNIHPFGPAGAPPEGFVAFQTDLTVQSQADDSLRAAIDCAAAGLVVQDTLGRIIDCNRAAERLLGLSRDQLLGLQSIDPRWQAVDEHGDPLPGDQHPAIRTLRSGLPERDVVMGIQLPQGPRRWLLVNTNVLPREDGSHWVVASFNDFTDAREVERGLETRWQQLRTMLDGTRTALWEWNVQTGEMRVDERWAAIVGHRLADLQPTTIQTWQRLAHPDDLAASDRQLQRHFAGELPHYDIECRVRHHDGSWRWVRDRGRVATSTPDGAPLWMYGTHDDISERKQAELAAHRAHARLQGLFELSPVGILRQHPDSGAVLECNDAMSEITGWSRVQLLALTGSALMAAGHAALDAQQQAELLASGRCAPRESALRHQDGRVVPVLLAAMRLCDPDGTPFLWTMVQDISQRKALEQQLLDAAHTDRLTGLPNRAGLMDRLDALLQPGRSADGPALALLFLDFDRFKLVNDAYGHGAGDALLMAIAERLRAVLADPTTPGPAVAARFGGDEFVLLMPALADAGQPLALAQRLLATLAQPYRIHGHEIHSSVSIGIALGQGPQSDAESLLRNADTAMYEAKRQGRGRSVLFDEGMHARLARSVQLEAALRQAIQRGELAVHYQPIVNLDSGQMVSVEALLRWHTPGLGEVAPDEFIPIAEESGQIVAIGEWVLRRACAQWAAWQAEDALQAPRAVSVNLSRVQMQLGDALLQTVQLALHDAGMPAAALQLEITERELMKDPAVALALMQGLRRIGVKLAMDDFGTGASSLGCLRDYPFDTIKIDKSFVNDLSRDMHVLAVAHATVNVIENLGMLSVAEGIEEPAEAAVLQSMGCRCGQGWLFAKAMPADQVLGWQRPAVAPVWG